MGGRWKGARRGCRFRVEKDDLTVRFNAICAGMPPRWATWPSNDRLHSLPCDEGLDMTNVSFDGFLPTIVRRGGGATEYVWQSRRAWN